VVKVGGSTLGSHDTTLADVAALARNGTRVVLVHGGGKLITDWLGKFGAPTRFLNGLRVTDADSIDVVVAVLAGLVNTSIVADLTRHGATAHGLSGVDSGLLMVRQADPELGFVGSLVNINRTPIDELLRRGAVPVVAPIGLGIDDGAPYNLNADTVAGALAAELDAESLVFLTDVEGVRGSKGLIRNLDGATARAMVVDGSIDGGMIPKVEACLVAGRAVIAAGRDAGALGRALAGDNGTSVTREAVVR
jgi:acetylglutamate kinase